MGPQDLGTLALWAEAKLELHLSYKCKCDSSLSWSSASMTKDGQGLLLTVFGLHFDRASGWKAGS